MTSTTETTPDRPTPTVVGAATDQSLVRADIRRLGDLLGECISRHEGAEVFDLVESVRMIVTQAHDAAEAGARREARTEIQAVLHRYPPETIGKLVRSFTTYFLLANVAEQVGRGRLVRSRAPEEGWLAEAVQDVVERVGAKELEAGIDKLAVRPVFTAHPTEASRRSVLHKLARIGAILHESSDPGSAARRRQDRALATLIDLIWMTDNLRHAQPTPVDEARNAIYYLESIMDSALPGLFATSTTSSNSTGSARTSTGRYCGSARGSAVTGTATRRSPRRSPAPSWPSSTRPCRVSW